MGEQSQHTSECQNSKFLTALLLKMSNQSYELFVQ